MSAFDGKALLLLIAIVALVIGFWPRFRAANARIDAHIDATVAEVFGELPTDPAPRRLTPALVGFTCALCHNRAQVRVDTDCELLAWAVRTNPTCGTCVATLAALDAEVSS